MKSYGPICLEQKELIQKALSGITTPFSEQSFGNLFLYRHLHQFQLYEEKEKLFVTGISYDQVPYLLPLQEIEDISIIRAIAQTTNSSCLYPIDEALWPLFERNGYHLTFNHDDSDYLFDRHQFDTLKGSTLAKKKNLYQQFVSSYSWHIKKLDDTTLQEAHSVLEEWYKEHSEAQDEQAMYDGLRFIDDLNLIGWVIFVETKPVGLYYGERQDKITFVDHCAKALPHIKGLGAFLQIECSRHLPEEIEKINWEQDLGLEGLRQSKYTFHPCLIRKKGRAFFSIDDTP